MPTSGDEQQVTEMATTLQLPAIPPFSVTDQKTLGQRWSTWVKGLEYFLVASNITEKKQKRAVLLHLAGADVQTVFATLSDTGEDYDTALAKLTEYFEPKKNIPFERHAFRQAAQGPTESIDAYVTRLRSLAKSCDYDKVDGMIRDQVVDKCASNSIRRRLLRETDLTLDGILRIVRSIEASDLHATTMEAASGPSEQQVNQISTGFQQTRQHRGNSGSRQQRNAKHPRFKSHDTRQLVCFCCGRAGHKAKDPSCPANGRTCNNCGKQGHFGGVCKGAKQAVKDPKSRPVTQQRTGIRYVATEHDTSDDEYLFAIGSNKPAEKTVPITVEDTLIPVIIDSGASVNVLDGSTFNKLSAKGIALRPSNVKIYPYGSETPLPVRGTFHTTVSTPEFHTQADFVVVENVHAGSLLGKKTAIQLGLLRVGPDYPRAINQVTVGSVQAIVDKHDAVFNGVGKLKDYQLKIHIDPAVTPVAQPQRRVPFHVRKDVEKKLQELQDLDIIEDVEGPTPWVSPLVAVPKSNGDVRVCVDMRRANDAVIRERHPIPTLEETLQALNGAAVFSKLDLRWGYHQVELHPESRILTTFSTHKGLKRYKRLIFGLSSAPEMYQYVIQQTLQGIPGARNISDDIIVFGSDQESHDRSLELTLSRLKSKGLTLNREKCIFSVPEIVFFGFKVSADGIAPDAKRVDAVKNARTPQNAAEVRSFLGLVNYCARFIPNFATLAEPLRKLTRSDTEWVWGKTQQEVFDRLRVILTSDCVVAHYDQSADTELKVDASPVGLGAILLQRSEGNVRPVAYASRTLTDVERRYSQTEKEALAVVWACERFHIYLYGKPFTLYTDHKPLEIIYSPKSKPPPRIERWALRLQPYRFTIVHMAGKTNPADVLSRLPLDNQPFRERNIAEEYINYVAMNAVPKALTLEQIVTATETDPILQQVKCCLSGSAWPDTPDLKPYKRVQDELCVKDGLILKGPRIVMPSTLWQATLSNAHEGHQGIVRTKQMVREKVWWPGIGQQVATMVKACLPCQSVAAKSTVEPLRPTVMPEKPWQEVHIDLCGPFPSGESLLVCEDACTRWPEVVILRSTTSAAIIGHLRKIFAVHGLPEKVVTDNGANLVSEEFETFLGTHGIKHRKVTPYWPQANAEVERFNKTIEKAIRTAHAEGKDWRTDMFTFLLNYRATPHASTGVSPARLHLGREIRTKVPQVETQMSNVLSAALQSAKIKDQQAKQRTKAYADKRNRASPSDIKAGDKVLLQQARQNKLSTRYDPEPYTVLKRKGPSLILQRGGGRVFMRNVSHVHKLHRSTAVQEEDDYEIDEDLPRAGDPNGDLPPAVDQDARRPVRVRHPPAYLNDFQL